VVGPPGYFDERFPFVIVCPLTTTRRGLSLHIEVKPTATTGITEVSYMQCELVRSVNRQRLVRRLGVIDAVAARSVHAVLRTLLDH
jgi:mRNA interferase MazF